MEVWKNIPGFFGIYQCSNMGRIRNVVTGHFLSLRPGQRGYIYIGIHPMRSMERKYLRVNRIVAILFIPNPHNKPYVNHKKGLKWDNRASELEWCTPSENDKHAFSLGLRTSPNPWKGKFGSDHNRSIKVVMLSDIPMEFSSVREAERVTGIANQNISKALNGTRKKAGGFAWKYGD